MKKFFKVFAIVLVVLFAVIAVLPFIFKGKIVETIKAEVNKSVHAEVDFGNIDLSLFKSFPDFCITMQNLSVSGLDEFQGDTLLYLPNMELDIDLFKVMQGSQISVKRIQLDDPVVFVKVLKDGAANYDIAVAGDEPAVEELDTTSSDMEFSLKHFQINHGIVVYDDYTMDMLFAMNDFSMGLQGDFTENTTDLKLNGTIAAVDFVYEGLSYLTQTNVVMDINMFLDLEQFKFTFKENSISLNSFPLTLDGWLAMPSEDIDMDLKFASPGSEFKPLLSLVPAVYMNDFSDLQAFGNVAFNGSAKGLYSETEIPGFDFNLKVDKAFFKYPDLPRSAENVNIDVKINNPGGDLDNTTIDISKFHVDLGQNPFDMNLLLKTPMSDPAINGQIDARIDFASLRDVIPLDDTDIKGVVDFSLKLMGQMSAIENEEYHKFAANGKMKLQDFEMTSPDIPDGMSISQANMNFSPQEINLTNFDATIGENDLSLQGHIENYLPYAFKDNEVLKGSLSIASTFLDISSLMGEEAEEAAATAEDTAALSVIEIPKNLDLTLTASLGRIVYGTMNIDQLEGVIKLKNGKADMEKVTMQMLGGSMLLNGYYDSYDVSKPEIDFGINITDFDIPETYASFVTVKKLAPIAKYSQGKVSAKLTINSLLDQSMMPVLASVNSQGRFTSNNIAISNAKFFTQLSEKLMTNSLKNPNLKNVDVQYVMQDGTLELKPFTTKVGSSKAVISSKQKIDGGLDATIAMSVPKSSMTSLTDGVLPKGIDKFLGDEINFDVLVKGTLSDPKLAVKLGDAGGSVIEGAKEQVKEVVTAKIDEQKDKLKNEAKEKAAKLIADAEKKAEKIKAEARKTAEKIKKEAENQALKVEKAAEKKSIIEKRLAKKAADKLRSEAKDKADRLVQEADEKADKVLEDAKKQAEKL